MILVDSSHSMHRRIGFVRDGVKRLIDFLRPDDRVIVAPFSRHLTAVTGPTTDHRTVADAIQNIRATGSTRHSRQPCRTVSNPTGLTRREWYSSPTRHDEDSSTPIDEVIAAVKAAQVTVYVIGTEALPVCHASANERSGRLASETGGADVSSARRCRGDGAGASRRRRPEPVSGELQSLTNQERDGPGGT